MGPHWLVMDAADEASSPFRTRIAAAGRCLPKTRLTTSELMSETRHNTHIDLERLTGIRERRVSLGEDDSYSLATKAALDCLEGRPISRLGRGGDQLQYHEIPWWAHAVP